MNWFVRVSACAYRAVIVLYPVELRYEYGTEMAAVFAEELADACRSGSATDVVGVWWRAVSEVLRIAIPGRLANASMPAPALGAMVQLAVLGSMLALATFAQPAIPHDVFHGVIMLRP